MTNQDVMAMLSPEEFYEKIMWLLQEYGRNYTDTRMAVIQWLKKDTNENVLFLAKKFNCFVDTKKEE